VAVLASSRPAPGGGGAAALVAAIGTALGHMVGSLTVKNDKKTGKPAEKTGMANAGSGASGGDVYGEIRRLMEQCEDIESRLLNQVEADEAGFMPLLEAYRLPKDRPDRLQMLEQATLGACQVPLRIMELCCEAIETMEVFAEKGSPMAVSDAACAAVCLKAALQAAILNVFCNTAAMRDRTEAEAMNRRCEERLAKYGEICDRVFTEVYRRFSS